MGRSGRDAPGGISPAASQQTEARSDHPGRVSLFGPGEQFRGPGWAGKCKESVSQKNALAACREWRSEV